ncbi:MAG TPA: HNH endonuclease [Solirubrobacterales bacterium]|nr:HNH endonuclease [Solirubrobacterales bacterium]
MAQSRASVAGARGAVSGPSPSNATGPVRATTSSRVLVLNATYEPINVCTVRRAAVLVLKAKAEVLEHGEARLHSERMSMDRPTVIRLVSYVRIPRDAHRRKITRKAVLARDSWTCQYCGSSKPGLTVDHVIPRSRGGKSVWENIVASCASCNRRKGNRLPREIRMHPRTRPTAPGPTVFIRIAAPTIPPAWQQYLPAAA